MSKEFMQLFDTVDDVLGETVRKIRSENKPVILFGAGYCLTAILDLCVTSRLAIHAIVDNNAEKCGGMVDGIVIISLEKLLQENVDYPILVSTSHYTEIIEQIKNTPYKGNLYHLPKTAYYKNALYTLEYIADKGERFENAYHMLQDECSRKVFIGMMKHTVSLDDKYLEEIAAYETDGYFGTDLYVNKNDEVIVDAGAFTGDTIDEFLCVPHNQFKRIYAFEPDRMNFDILKKNVSNDSKIIPVCAGLGNKCTTLKFISGGSVSSKIDDKGDDTINVETIDHFITNDIPTFIKMDIEGAEKDALMGGERTLAQYHPTLAVSVYHKKEDMFDLLETIDQIGQGKYKFYLRHTFYYQQVRIQPDVVLYAIAD